MPRKGHRVRGHIKNRNHQQWLNERSLRRFAEAIHREQYERRKADEEDHLEALNGFNELDRYADDDALAWDDDPYDQ